MSGSAAEPTKVDTKVKAHGKGVHWYRTDLESVNEPARLLLEEYSGVPSNEVISHVLSTVSHRHLLHLPPRIIHAFSNDHTRADHLKRETGHGISFPTPVLDGSRS